MLTFHPTYKKTKDGYRPMVIVRNTKGQCVGSRVAAGRTCANLYEARTAAWIACHRVTLDQPFRIA